MAQDPRLLLSKADKMAQSAGGGFSLFGGRTDKYEQAAELYMQAANAFRMQKQNKEAGEAFEKAAAEPADAANTYVEIFKVLRKDDPQTAAASLTKSINHYTLQGNFRRAATNQVNLAEVLENEIGDQKKALEAYHTAASWFEGDNAEALANKNWLKCADLCGLEGEYGQATELFEKVSKTSISNNLMRWSVKDYLLKAGICHLASGDMIATSRALEQYRELDNSFPQTREHQLLVDLVAAIEGGNQEEFQDKLFQYDQMSKLDKWKTTLLLRIKDSIENAEEDFA
ncbi:MAG: hypothetical protein Q9227_001007 [Pyrenula ochraceoflavens]